MTETPPATASPDTSEADCSCDGETKMAGDLSDDCLEMLLDEQISGFDSLMFEAGANAGSAHSIVRHSAARKFNQEDPIEAAATEMILQKPTV